MFSAFGRFIEEYLKKRKKYIELELAATNLRKMVEFSFRKENDLFFVGL
jgi:hypothetical protein